MHTLDLRKKQTPGAIVHALVILGEFLVILAVFAMVFLFMVALA